MSHQLKFFKAVKRMAEAEVKELMELESVDVNKTNKDGLAALHLSVQNEDIATTKLLLRSNGIDVNVPDSPYRWTPLFYSVLGGNNTLEILKLLISHKNIEINHQDASKRTALHLAAESNLVSQIQLLIDFKVKLDARNNKGETALHTAIGHANIEAITKLLENNIGLNEADLNGFTPLHLAVKENLPNVVVSLLQQLRGSTIDYTGSKDTMGNTALHIAMKKHYRGIADVLISYGFNQMELNKDGRTPEDLWLLSTQQIESVKQLKAEASEMESQRKRELNKKDQQTTEVYNFCITYGLPETMADVLYSKKFRNTDESFFSIDERLLLSLKVPPSDIRKFLHAQRKLAISIQDEVDAIFKMQANARRALQRKHLITAIISLVVLFAAIYIYFLFASKR